MPLCEEVALKHAVIVKRLAEGRSELLLIRVAINKEQDDGLEEVLVTTLSLKVGESCKDEFKLAPVLDDVAMWAENTAHADV